MIVIPEVIRSSRSARDRADRMKSVRLWASGPSPKAILNGYRMPVASSGLLNCYTPKERNRQRRSRGCRIISKPIWKRISHWHSCQPSPLFSPWHSYRLFKELFGVTPAEYIRRLRLFPLRHAAEGGQCLVTEAAFDCGFGSVDGYIRAFYREFGCRPGNI